MDERISIVSPKRVRGLWAEVGVLGLLTATAVVYFISNPPFAEPYANRTFHNAEFSARNLRGVHLRVEAEVGGDVTEEDEAGASHGEPLGLAGQRAVAEDANRHTGGVVVAEPPAGHAGGVAVERPLKAELRVAADVEFLVPVLPLLPPPVQRVEQRL